MTAIRLVVAANRAIHSERNKKHIGELESLIERLNAKRAESGSIGADPAAPSASRNTAGALEKRLYELESGPTGNGPSSTVIANSTGCSSVYASTFPFNPYTDPWVNSLFQDAQPLAKGIFEGLSATAAEDFRRCAPPSSNWTTPTIRTSTTRSSAPSTGRSSRTKNWACCRRCSPSAATAPPTTSASARCRVCWPPTRRSRSWC